MRIAQTLMSGLARQRKGVSALKSLGLLLLVTHAFIVSTTHFHKPAPPCDLSYLSGPQLSQQGSCDDNQGAQSDTDCPSCILQRNFVSDVRIIPLVINLTPQSIIREAFLLDPRLHDTCLISSSRAPPLA